MLATFSRVNARFAIVLLLLAAAVIGFTGYKLASASTPYSVQSGDTLSDIAAKNGVDAGQLDLWISQVVALNGLSSPDALTVGQQLTLPVAISGGGTGSAGGGAGSTGSGAGTATTTAGSTYTVKDGDSLYGIASSNGVTDVSSWIASVLTLNDLSSADKINVGDVLKLPGNTTSAGSSNTSAVDTTTTVQYTVQAGDTLYDIAVKNGVSDGNLGAWVSAVLKLNNLDSPDMLVLGEALKLPAKKSSGTSNTTSTSTATTTTATIAYTVKAGDTLYDIAMSHGAKDATYSSWLDTVLTLNNLSSPNVLREGDSLKLPDLLGSNTTGGTSGAAVSPSTAQAAATSFAFSGASVTYTVKGGDTWAGIAAKQGVPQEQIQTWIDNALTLSHMGKDDKLMDGVVLLVPAQGSITSTTPAPAAASTVPTPSTSGSSSSTTPATTKVTSTYTVQSGDTLDDIAAKYKIGAGQISGWIKDVLDLNSLSSPDLLIVGQKLTVPGELPAAPATTTAASPTTSPATSGSATTPASAGTTTNKPATAPTVSPPATAPALVHGGSGTCYYTVAATDSWDAIAAKLGVSNDKKSDWIDGIAALNGIKNNALPIGDAIRLLC